MAGPGKGGTGKCIGEGTGKEYLTVDDRNAVQCERNGINR